MKLWSGIALSSLLLILVISDEFESNEEFMMYKCMKQEYALASCCDLPHMKNEVMEKCKDHLNKHNGEGVTCFMECIYLESSIIDAEGTLNKDKLIESNDEIFFNHQNEDLKEALHKSILDCFDKYEQKKEKIDEYMATESPECNMVPYILNTCFLASVDRMCPNLSVWKNCTRCETVKVKFEVNDQCAEFYAKD